MVNAEKWAAALTPGVKRWAVDSYDYPEPEYFSDIMYSEEDSNKKIERYMDTAQVPLLQKIKSGQIPAVETQQGYEYDIENELWGSQIIFDYDIMRFDQYGVVMKKSKGLGKSARRTLEYICADYFNQGSTAAANGGDAVPLFSASHPATGPNGSTQSNYDTLSFDATNLELVRRRMLAFTDDDGVFVNPNPSMVVCGTGDVEQKVYEVIGSKGEPYVSSNTANFMYGRFMAVVWRNFWSSSTSWMVVDPELMKMWMILQWVDRTEFYRNEEFNTLAAAYAVTMYLGRGHTNWRFGYKCEPA